MASVRAIGGRCRSPAQRDSTRAESIEPVTLWVNEALRFFLPDSILFDISEPFPSSRGRTVPREDGLAKMSASFAMAIAAIAIALFGAQAEAQSVARIEVQPIQTVTLKTAQFLPET